MVLSSERVPGAGLCLLDSICWTACPLQPHHQGIFDASEFTGLGLCEWNSLGGLPGEVGVVPSFLSPQRLPAVWAMLASTRPGSWKRCLSTAQTALVSSALCLLHLCSEMSISLYSAFPQSPAQPLSTHPVVCSLARIKPPGTWSILSYNAAQSDHWGDPWLAGCAAPLNQQDLGRLLSFWRSYAYFRLKLV